MKTNGRTKWALLLAVCLPAILSGQDASTGISPVLSKVKSYQATNPYEELWLHTDRESYVAGETVRVKAYLLSYPDLIISVKESYSYVELLDYYNNQVAQITVMLDQGTGESQFLLPDSLVTGSYLLRAYTNVMKNYLPHGCFMKKITVANPFRNKFLDLYTSQKFSHDPPSKVYFFPEGGTLVSGLMTKVGVTLLNQYGYPAGCNALVTNSKDEILTEVTVDSTGIGAFEFVPEHGESYFFTPAGTGQRFPIPTSSDSGVSLRVSGTASDGFRILLRERGHGSQNRTAGGFILIQSRGKISFTGDLPLWRNEYELRVPAARMAEGINNIAVFDESGRFLAERYVFITPGTSESLPLSINDNPGRRTRITMEIADPDNRISITDQPEGSISVAASVTADRYVTASDYLLLGSEFRHSSDAPLLTGIFPWLTPEGKDNLLLGIESVWLNWREVSTGQWDPPLFLEEVNGRYLGVSLAGTNGMADDMSLTAFLTGWGKRQSFQYSTADTTGRFRFFLEKNHETDAIIIRTDDRSSNRPLIIEDSFSDSYLTSSFRPDTTPMPAVMHELDKMAARYQVRKIYGISDSGISDSTVKQEVKGWRFYGIPDQEVPLDEYISLSSMREIFFELIKRLSVRSDRKEGGTVIWDPVLKRSPALFIDQVPVDDAETILSLEPAHVKQIDIITGDYLFGEKVFPGIVNVITRNGNFSESRLPDKTLRAPHTMADLPSAFIAPDHSTNENSRIPDLRNTLLWDCNPEREAGHGLSVVFFSPDDSQLCDITVTLIDREGKIKSARERILLTGN